jgi:hypothetical protein
MRFYIIKQAISLLFVSSAVALRGGSVRSSKLVPDAVIDIGILSSTAAAAGADVDHQYEVDRQKDHVLTAGPEEVSTYVSEAENVETHDNAYIPSLGMTEGANCKALSRDCSICYTYRSYYFLGNGCCCFDSTSK